MTKKKVAPVDVTGASVLVIDDNSVNRSILFEQLNSWDFKVKTSSSGLDGLTELRQMARSGASYELLILDYQMPNMDGAQVAITIRNDELLKNTPIIMLTSVDNMTDGKLFSELNIQDHLMKPARASHMLESIITVLQNARDENTTPGIAVDNPQNAQAVYVPLPKERFQAAIIKDRTHVEILVAEDNEVNQIVIEQILTANGHNCTIVENGQLLVDHFKSVRPDLILMDVSMPVMSGLDATKVIRKIEVETGGHVPIIGLTAHALKDDRKMCLDAGMDDYVMKPISVDVLVAAIERNLQTTNKPANTLQLPSATA